MIQARLERDGDWIAVIDTSEGWIGAFAIPPWGITGNFAAWLVAWGQRNGYAIPTIPGPMHLYRNVRYRTLLISPSTKRYYE
jgi:hypothetical protein